MRQGFPKAAKGLRVGLLGGSFDPPHEGHVHVTRRALQGFGLDRVWWLVSPGNPLKPNPPQDMARRLVACRALMRHPRVEVTDVEARLGTAYTAETLEALSAVYAGVRFVWLMGADNLAGFHRWDRWETIAATAPIGVVARPGEQLRAGLSPAARRLARRRLSSGAASGLALREAPAWALLTGPMSDQSSTRLRAGGAWP
ncbi:MAG: nicotinate-nucleotide adenylyltransferase [Pseudomonadota bacterium]